MMRYPGGKLRLMKRIDQEILAHYPESKDSNWVIAEPFTGGGGSLINMAKDFPNWTFHINDLDSDVYGFWKFFAKASDSAMENFCDKILATKPTVALHKEIFNSRPSSDFDCAFRVFFLNKTSFSGIINKWRPIGGVDQSSDWTVDEYWKGPERMVRDIQRARNFLKGRIIKVTNQDCRDVIRQQKFDFVYADPPYLTNGAQWYNGKFNFFILEDFRKCLTELPRWCISIDLIEETKTLFSGDKIQLLSLKYTTKSSYKNEKQEKIKSSQEMLIFPRDPK
jgi:DNA adenine methylase